MIIFLSIILILTIFVCVALSVVIKKSIDRIREYDTFFEELEDQIEDSLRLLRNSEESIKISMSTPVQFDDPIVHKIIRSIHSAYSAINLIDFKLQTFIVEDDDEKIENLTTKDKEVVVNFLENNHNNDVK